MLEMPDPQSGLRVRALEEEVCQPTCFPGPHRSSDTARHGVGPERPVRLRMRYPPGPGVLPPPKCRPSVSDCFGTAWYRSPLANPACQEPSAQAERGVDAYGRLFRVLLVHPVPGHTAPSNNLSTDRRRQFVASSGRSSGILDRHCGEYLFALRHTCHRPRADADNSIESISHPFQTPPHRPGGVY